VVELAGSRQGIIIVDFCSGGGHLGLLLAHLLPQVSPVFRIRIQAFCSFRIQAFCSFRIQSVFVKTPIFFINPKKGVFALLRNH
jgi:hypothetical protein